jgi:adenosylcobinamide amidohydrolase
MQTMLLGSYYKGVEINRKDKILFARFLKPHQVLSTSKGGGGLRDDLKYIINHQGCEPAGHMHRLPASVWRDTEKHSQRICQPWGFPAESCAILGTAANMNNAAFQSETFRELEVVAVCTGGVECNAGRAGDPASNFETADGFEKIRDQEDINGPGTINTMLFINKPLTPGTLTRTIVTATEAKTAVLQELAVNSRYSDKLATGTGTDQIAVATLLNDEPPLTSAGKHVSLGELIGLAVYKAIKKTLALQNSLTPEGQCSIKIHLERLGLTRRTLLEKLSHSLQQDQAELLENNLTVIERDPVSVAAVAAMVHLKDKFTWGTLPPACWSEVMGSYAAMIACAVSGDYERLAIYREELAPLQAENTNKAFVEVVCRALARGFADKWEKT